MFRRMPVRFVAGVVALVTIAVPVAAATSAFGDPISDKRAEAREVADKLDSLEQQAEVYAEQYNDARLALADVQQKVNAAKARVASTTSDLRKRRDDVAGYAVNAYMMGDQGGTATDVLGSSDGNEVGRREGYTSAAIGNREDLLDRLHTAKAEAESQTTALHKAEQAAQAAKEKVDAKRKAAENAVDEQQQVVSRVKGELSRLLAAEQRRRAAAAAARARAASRALVSRQAASRPTADQPSAPSVDAPSSPSAPPVANPPVGQGAGAAIAAARSVLGVRYTWGGADPSTGFDCSGLVMWAWQHGGRSLPHSSAAQYSSTQHISMDELQPGDLVFYGSPIHHVALYIGGGQIIHAPHTGSYVQVASVYYWSDVAGAGRV